MGIGDANIPMKYEDLTLGGHMSTAGGVWNASTRAKEFGFKTFQIFSKNQMQWKARPIPDGEAKKFREEVSGAKQSKLMAHASYLLNLGSAKSELRDKSRDGLFEELRRCDLLAIENLVLHPGSASGTTEKAAIAGIASGISEGLSRTSNASVLIETAAGQGSAVGANFESLAEILDGIGDKGRTGICFDTCHVYASGYDIKDPGHYAETMDRFKSIVGLDRLRAFHLNDTKKGLGSRVDRHEQIGKGMIGIDGILNLLTDERLGGTPFVLETPLGEEGYGMDLEEIKKGLNGDPN